MPAFDQPPPHGIVRGWLGPTAVEALLAYARTNRERFAASSLGHGGTARIDPLRRQSEKLPDLGPFEALIETRMTEVMPAMIAALGTASFTPARFELELVAHNDGAFYKRHKDTVLARPAPGASASSVRSIIFTVSRRRSAAARSACIH